MIVLLLVLTDLGLDGLNLVLLGLEDGFESPVLFFCLCELRHQFLELLVDSRVGFVLHIDPLDAPPRQRLQAVEYLLLLQLLGQGVLNPLQPILVILDEVVGVSYFVRVLHLPEHLIV